MGPLHLTGPQGRRITTVNAFLADLPELLGSMTVDPRCFVSVAEFDDSRYVQFWVEPAGELIVEVISNRHLSEAHPLSGRDESLLRATGWHAPSSALNPNWWIEASGPAEILEAIAMTIHVVRHVLGEVSQNRVTMRSWALDRDGESYNHVRYEARVSYHDALRALRRDLDQW